MPTQNTLNQFIARVVSGAHAEAIEEFYTPNATTQENQSPPRAGRDVLENYMGDRVDCAGNVFYDPVQFIRV